MPHEPTPIQKTSARWGLASILIFIIGALVMRAMYLNQKAAFTKAYMEHQEDLAWKAADECLDYLESIERMLRAMPAAAAEAERAVATDSSNSVLLSTYVNQYKDIGVESAAVFGPDGLIASTGEHFAPPAGPSPEFADFIRAALVAEKMKPRLADITALDGPDNVKKSVALVTVPRNCEPGAPFRCSRIAAALVDTRPLSYSIQRLVRGENKSAIFVLDRKGVFISHPSAEFIGSGALEAFDLEHNPDLEAIIEKMKKGHGATGWYYAPSRLTGKGMVRWGIAFEPVRFGGDIWAVGASFQEDDVPFLRRFLKKYLAAGFAWLLALVVFNLLYLRSRAQYYNLELRVRQLADSAAVNDILRSVNAELNDAKRKLEVKTKEFEAIHHEREALLEKLEELQKHLFTSLSRPTREHREIMRELRKIVRVLRRPPEGRFWKNVDSD